MVLRDMFRTKTNRKEVGEAANAKNTNVVANKAPDDILFSLDIWVEGVDPKMEYISLETFYSLIVVNFYTWL